MFESVPFSEVFLFTKHLSVLLKSGIPIVEAIDIIRQQTKSAGARKVFKSVSQDVATGQKLSVALGKFPHVFNAFYINLISVGEESGNLENNLDHLTTYLKKANDFRKKVFAAMLYPGLVLTTTFVAGMGIALFVLPKLTELFESLDVTLPITTQILLFGAGIFKNYGIFIVIGCVFSVLLFKLLISLKPVKPAWHQFLLTLPAIGYFLQCAEMSQLCRNFGIMLKSGLPITSALASLEETQNNLIFKRYVHLVRVSLDSGKQIEQALLNSQVQYIPLIAKKMIGVGERTGRLDETLLYLGDYFEDEVDTITKNLNTILEPAILLVVGVVVAFVAFSIISPIYELTASVRR